jgi:hypothetical protein
MKPDEYREEHEPCAQCGKPVLVTHSMHRSRALSPGKTIGFLCTTCKKERSFPDPPPHLRIIKK